MSDARHASVTASTPAWREAAINSPEARAAWRWHAGGIPLLPGRVRRWLAPWALRSAPTVAVALPFGARMALDLREYVQCTIAITGEWEGEIFDAVAPLVEAGSTVLDVGAHVGYAALRLAWMTGPTGRVVAVEPLPAHQAAVSRQFALNGRAAQLTLVDAAASDREGTATFHVPDGQNAGIGTLADVGGTTRTVRTLALDDWLDAHGVATVSLLKLDIEGAEALALRGLARALGAHRVRALLIELHPGELPAFGSTAEREIAQLEAHGYRVRHWDNRGRFADAPPPEGIQYVLAVAPGVPFPGDAR